MNNGQLKTGYKQTEVGVIPEEWEVKAIGDLGSIVRGGSPRPAGDSRYFNGTFIPWVTVAALTNIPDNQLSVTETVGCLTEEGAKHSRTLDENTIIIANSGATLGVAKILGLTCCANDGIAAIINQIYGDKGFVCHYINTKTKYLRDVVATGNGQPNLNTTLLKRMLIPFPPAREQRAIAAALSDVDALLAKLDQLIAKKRDLKLATMQHLLTGKTRLPGFKGEWTSINISRDVLLKARIGWQALTTKEYLDNGTYYLVTGIDFIGGRVNWSTCHFVDEWRYKQDRNIQLRNGDVLLTKDGTIGKVGYVENLHDPATLNSGIFVIRSLGSTFFPLFLFYVLSSKIFNDFLSKINAGSTITHLYQKDFITFDFLAPEINEQTAIAAVLSDMDAEIAALEARRDKTRDIKQGMMQELLTGRIRLI